MSIPHHYIETTQALEGFCQGIPPGSFITLDTEFIRERTYLPQLCLIQVATETTAALIDPLAPGLSLAPFFQILKDQTILKVFHAARQDVEIFYEYLGEIPTPLYDTQIAAMACGYGESASYESLVQKISHQTLDKTARFSNWSQRPLNSKQVRYALSDVTHLREIYQKLKSVIQEKNREEWIQEELSTLRDPKTYTPDPLRLLLKLNLNTSKPAVMTRAYHLILWREKKARQDNRPRQTILRDEVLIELALHNPQSLEELYQTRSVRGGSLSKGTPEDLLNTLEYANTLSKEDYPLLPRPSLEPPINSLTQDLLRLLLKYIAHQEGVAEKIIASSSDLNALARYGEKASVPCLKGWRFEIFGQQALNLLNEKVGFSIKNGNVILDKVMAP